MAEDDGVETIAVAFHEAYEAQSSAFGWETHESTRVPWSMVPEENRALMRSVISTLIERGVISAGGAGLELAAARERLAEIARMAGAWDSPPERAPGGIE